MILSFFYHFGFVVFSSSWELWSNNINTIQYLQSPMYQVIYHQALKTLKSSAVSSTYEPSEIILTARWSALCWRCIALHWGSDVLHWVSVSEPWAQIDLTTRLQNQCFVPRDVRRVPNPSHFTGCSELSLLVGKDLFLRKKGWWTRGRVMVIWCEEWLCVS